MALEPSPGSCAAPVVGSLAIMLTTEAVAGEIVAMLVGSIGLIAAAPLTTALAVLAARRMSPADLADAHATHAH